MLGSCLAYPEQQIMNRPYSIVLADDHIQFRREMKKMMAEIPGIKVTGEAGNRAELFALLEKSPPQMVILDISMPDLRAWEGTQLIKLHYPDIKVLILTMDQEKEYLCHGLAVGAAGVLPKQHVAGQISRAIAAVRRGKIYLPPQSSDKSGRWPSVATATRSERSARDIS
jgi:two-component system response regulator NreC